MQFASNKFIATLVISNVVAFGVIFILIWMMWNNNAASTQNIPTSNRSEAKSIQQTPLLKTKTMTIAEAITQEVKSANLESVIQAHSNSSDTGTLSDKAYIGAYKKMENNQKPKLSYSEKEVITVKAANLSGNTQANDNNNLNIVDVSQLKISSGTGQSLTQQVSSLVSESTSKNTSASKKNSGLQDYLKKLNTEGEKRKNEMRTIKVKRGETLWRISIRAYGTGFKYKKIFKANPHLTSPDSITTGEILRVPL
ncbi:MAG: hypothetical protein COA54_13875 [Thiotrichaceae bacterium]|nr:MAG: hypothetical protein COA54_13875 [Thiotrichaceae bacterium]